jgi:hypothetical protein
MRAFLGAFSIVLAAPLLLATACKSDPPPQDNATIGGTSTITTSSTTSSGSGGAATSGAGGAGQGGHAAGGAGGHAGGGHAGGAGGSAPPKPSCDEYCKYITLDCHDIDAQYKNEDVCKKLCPVFPVGTSADEKGDTLGCRIHFVNAAQSLPAGNCAIAGPGGDGVCGDNCEGFCQLAHKFCPAVWADDKACKADCATFATTPWYSANVVNGNSLACRMFYATMAAEDPLYCDAIKKLSSTCVDMPGSP